MEVELPSRDILWVVPILVRKRKANLNRFEQVNVTSHGLVVIVGRRLERAYWARHDPRKFGILRSSMSRLRALHCTVAYHGDYRVFLNQLPYHSHLIFKIIRPYLLYWRHACTVLLRRARGGGSNWGTRRRRRASLGRAASVDHVDAPTMANKCGAFACAP